MGLSNCCNITNVTYDIAQINSQDKIHSVTDCNAMFIGNKSFRRTYRVLIKFDLKHLPDKTQIISAVLGINVIGTVSDFNPHSRLIGYTLNSNWDVNTINWNNQPSIDLTNKLFVKSVRRGQKYHFDITDQVINWHKCPTTNYGMVLTCSEDIRNSQIQICTDYGTSNNLALQIDCIFEQVVHVVIDPAQFFEYTEDIFASTGEYFTTIRDISQMKIGSYLVKNNGNVPIDVVIEYSPDSVNFMKENRVVSVSPGTMELTTPTWFDKYIRLSITKPFDGNTATINTWLELQK